MTTTNQSAPRRYFEAVRHDLIAIVEGRDLRILEVGCGTGSTGAALIDSGVAREVVGIEFEPTSAESAREVLNAVHEVDIEAFDVAQLGTFDVVIIGDVLEHLVDPWRVVKNLSGLLSADGQLILSIPNVRCYAFWVPIVFRGRLDYGDSGLMDRTHIRWFTRSTAVEMLEHAGLDVVVSGVLLVGATRGPLARLMARTMGPFGVVQYLLCGRPIR